MADTFDIKDFERRMDGALNSGEKQTVTFDKLIIATGATAKRLNLPGEKTLWNRGMSACAVCDGFFYRGKDVAIVGAGDTAAAAVVRQGAK